MMKTSPSDVLFAASRVPQVTALFWVAKIISTGMGETTSDFFVTTIAPEVAVGVAGILLVVALVLQFRSSGYSPVRYWFAIAMVSVFGTMAADVAHVALGIPYLVSTTVFAVTLGVVFLAWFQIERTLSIHDITTRRREAFYWAAVLATFALGTAAGDLVAHNFGLGYLGSGVVFGLLFLVPIVGFAVVGLSPVVTFWIAYVLTRPLGASFADWAGVGTARGGLDLGTGSVSAVLLVLLVTTVVLMVRRRSGSGGAHG